MNNMLNYLRTKIQKIEVESPTKKCPKNLLTPSQQIYLDQIHNYIEAGGGYTILKQKLFKDINNNYMHDSPLVQEIVIMLRKGLETREKEKERRCLGVVEDLVGNCGVVMNQAFNQERFCQVLMATGLYLRKLKSADRDQIRQRACGIFLYWNLKFKSQPNYIYNSYYQKLRREQAEFPTIPYIKDLQKPPTPSSTSQPQQLPQISQQDLQNIEQILLDCEDTVKTTKLYMKEYVEKIDTNYVRLLKAKMKKIYAISTVAAEGKVKLKEIQKERLGKVYKEIRGLLKDIDKMNQAVLREKALEKEKDFLKQKMDIISPKKTEKEIPKLQTTPIKKQKSLTQQHHQQPVLIAQIHSSGKKSSNSEQKTIIPTNNDLLDIIDVATTAPIPVPTPVNTVNVPTQVPVVNTVRQSTPQKKVSHGQHSSNKNLMEMEEQEEEADIPNKQGFFSTPTKFNKVSSNASGSDLKDVDEDFVNNTPTPKKLQKAESNASGNDLLDIDEDLAKTTQIPQNQPQIKSNTSLHERFQTQPHPEHEPFPQLATPPKPKKPQNDEKLLDLEADSYTSPASEKKLNFKELYSANQLSPELKDLDLIGSQEKMKSKESLKSSDDEKEFGEFL